MDFEGPDPGFRISDIPQGRIQLRSDRRIDDVAQQVPISSSVEPEVLGNQPRLVLEAALLLEILRRDTFKNQVFELHLFYQ